jgi:hypothetical protein
LIFRLMVVLIQGCDNCPNKGNSPYQAMSDIKINCKGVTKLLKNQNIHKATGPDSILSFILKSAADQLAPILTDIFQTSIDTSPFWTLALDKWPEFVGIFFVVSADFFHILFICLSYFILNFLLESFISIDISFLLKTSETQNISMEKSRYLQDKGRSRIIWKHRKERYWITLARFERRNTKHHW